MYTMSYYDISQRDETQARARRYSFWSKVERVTGPAHKIARAFLIVNGVIAMAGLFSLLTGIGEMTALLNLSPVGVMVAIPFLFAHEFVFKKLRANADYRMGSHEYATILEAIRWAGIKNPVQYVASHYEHIDAYRKVRGVARDEISYPSSTPEEYSKKSTVMNEHRIATLVLADPNRTEQIIDLIKDRGMKTYEEIKTVLDETKEQPLPLQDGAL